MHPLHGPHGPGPDGVDPLSLDVFRAFKRAMILNRHLMMAMLSEDDLHPAQGGCLLVLAHAEGLSQSELAAALHVSRPTVTAMLQKMESAGTIERRPDERDQRVTRLFLTPAGRDLAARMRAVHGEIISATVGSLAETDRADLLRLLDELNLRAAAMLDEHAGASGARSCETHGRAAEGPEGAGR